MEPLSYIPCILAARCGALDLLTYAHEQGCGLRHVCTYAARHGHLECLKYAHEHGGKWGMLTCCDAARGGHWDCLRYAYERGCPYPVELRPTIVQQVLMPKWRNLVKARGICMFWLGETCVSTCAPEGAGRKRDRAAFEAEFVVL